MLVIQQMFLFLFKSKYRRKLELVSELCDSLKVITRLMVVYMFVTFVSMFGERFSVNGLSTSHGSAVSKCLFTSDCSNNGVCRNETCVCNDGWQGPHCQYCGGKVRLASTYGSIHDGLGNYSIGVKCSWLIDAPNSTISMHVEEFATECGWDHLYIFDGDSVESPLLAVFSGLMYKDTYAIRHVPQITAKSGAALIHFFSDDAYNMSGFNITYRINGCPSITSSTNCSGNGICIDGTCTCDAGWDGIACHLSICPNNCYNSLGHGNCSPEHHRCECNDPWAGADCNQDSSKGYWMAVTPQDYIPPELASAGAVVWRDTLYLVSGQSYISNSDTIYTYDFNGNVWETPKLDGVDPGQRYGHSSVLYGDKIYVYGGVRGNRGVTNELWTFDINAKIWENITVRAEPCNGSYPYCGPLKVAGHTATLVTSSNKKSDRMVVLFGHSPQLGYLNTVQEFYFGTREWHFIEAVGFPVKGGYGHSSAYDPFSSLIYVYGGIVSESEATHVLSSKIYSYDPHLHVWKMLTNAPSARFLHTGNFIYPGLMIVFGGNTHNDTSHSFGAKCYSNELLVYDVICDSWHGLLSDGYEIQADLARYGHAAVTFEKKLYIFGGFDGQMLSDILQYTPGNCSAFRTSAECLNRRPGIKCVWDRKNQRCKAITDVRRAYLSKDRDEFLQCPEKDRTSIAHLILRNTERCSTLADCRSCVQTSWNCIWCGNFCTKERCRLSGNNPNDAAIVTELDRCPVDHTSICRVLHTCAACSANQTCHWSYEGHCNSSKNQTKANEVGFPHLYHMTHHQTLQLQEPAVATCPISCADLTSCLNCTQEECIWCQNEGRCVDKNAYTVSFPYGQCREWTTASYKCRSGTGTDATITSQCSYYKTCAQCRDDPACGWCDDGSGTGLGACMTGGYQGPNLHDLSLPSSTCPSERWHFTTCPRCQCNGHSTCEVTTGPMPVQFCVQPCRNDTVGAHCDKCRDGYWGSAVNGGKCQLCQCNGQAQRCNHETGKCYCTTKGLTGDHCEKCDATNHYLGDPLSGKGSCFYELTIDYQFTFNLSKKEDRHYTQINFRNSPIKPDIDADFTIACSVPAKMNITVKSINGPERAIFTGYNCTNFRTRFTKADHNFGVEDNMTLTTFYVYVYDFQPPLWIQISFSQYPKLNLQQFFITFSSCFLALLLVAAIMWKVKQKFDLYRRRQRLFVEMEQMASRPFSQVLVEVDKHEIDLKAMRKGNKNNAPSPIALEPCAGNRAAVLSLLVRLPTGGDSYTPSGQSAGLAVASALVTLGNPRRNSLESLPKEGKKTRQKGQSQHPDG